MAGDIPKKGKLTFKGDKDHKLVLSTSLTVFTNESGLTKSFQEKEEEKG
jgi:hypothetical protein